MTSTIVARTVTVEVDRSSDMVKWNRVPSDSELSQKLRRAVAEIVNHISSTAGISVTVANFYFKEPIGD